MAVLLCCSKTKTGNDKAPIAFFATRKEKKKAMATELLSPSLLGTRHGTFSAGLYILTIENHHP